MVNKSFSSRFRVFKGIIRIISLKKRKNGLPYSVKGKDAFIPPEWSRTCSLTLGDETIVSEPSYRCSNSRFHQQSALTGKNTGIGRMTGDT